MKEFIISTLLGIGLVLAILWPVSLQGLAPFPGNLLVGRFFPWESMSWEGHPTGVPYKEFIAADAVRQTYPWRYLAIEQLQQGQLPWWNPYSFAGTPLLANMQAAPFYPLNFLYWLMNFNLAWVVQVLLQPILAFVFTYMFVRSLKLSKLAGVVSGLGFAFSGYLVVWLELNTVGHAALWLPFILWSLNKAQKQFGWYAVASCGLIASIFANHLQTTLYIFVLIGSYWFYLQYQAKSRNTKLIQMHLGAFILMLTITLAVTSIQLVPGWQLLQQSARSGQDKLIFNQFLLPWSHLVTALIPNYFGNPASNNYFGQDYGEFMVYAGIVAILLALISLNRFKQNTHIKFFAIVAGVSLIFALDNPLALIPQWLGVPVLESSAPARALFVWHFAMAILAGFGFDQLSKRPKQIIKPIVFMCLMMIVISAYTVIKYILNTDQVVRIQTLTSIKHLLPTWAILMAIGLLAWVGLIRQLKLKQPYLWGIGLLILASVEFSWFATRYLPFSQWQFFYPDSPPTKYLQTQGNHARFFGDYTASVISNVWLPYKLFGVEGYDSLYLRRYGELVAAAANQGQLPARINRSDANLAANQDDFYRQRLQDVLGVIYILDKDEFAPAGQANIERFDPQRYSLIWEQNPYRIYQNLQALPRAILVPEYQVLATDDSLLERFFDSDWQPSLTVLVEQAQFENLKGDFSQLEANQFTKPVESEVVITSYQPHRVIIKAKTPQPQILVLSDAYYSDWQAYVNQQATPIFRVNYSFRGVIVPAGESTIEFVYQP